jgi:hypothetical protein
MTSTTVRPATTAVSSQDRTAGTLALVCAGISVVTGASQILFPQDEDPAIDPRTRLILVGVSVMLWLLAAVYVRLGAYARSAWAARTAAAGAVLLTVGMISSAIRGEDFSWFPLVATVANAAWAIGSIALAVSLWRADRLHRALAAGVVLVMPGTIFLSQLGGGVLVGAYLAVLGWLLRRNQATR